MLISNAFPFFSPVIPTAGHHRPARPPRERSPGTRTPAGSTTRAVRRSAPRPARRRRWPRVRRRDGIGRPIRRRRRPAPHPRTPNAAPAAAAHRSARRPSRPADPAESTMRQAGSAPSASRSAARRSTRASFGGAAVAAAAAAVATAMPAPRHTRQHVETGCDRQRIGAVRRPAARGVPDARRPVSAPAPAPATGRGRSTRHGQQHRRGVITTADPIGDAVGPQQAAARQRRTDHQQPSARVPVEQEGQRSGPDQLAQQHAEHRQARQYRRGCARTGHARCHPRREPLPLSDIALRGTHQRGYRQPVVAGQLPAHRESIPMRGQGRRLRGGAQAGRDVGPQSGPRRDRPQRLRNRANRFVGGDAERAHRMGADSQFTDEHVECGFQRLRPRRRARRIATAAAVAQARGRAARPRRRAPLSAAAARPRHRRHPRRCSPPAARPAGATDGLRAPERAGAAARAEGP